MKKLTGCRGQSLIEFALIMPLVLVVALGVIETGYALLDQHVVTKLSREGSNLISRDTIIDDAANAMRNMNSRPVDFDTRSRFIFSVLKKGATTGTANYDKIVLYQRYEYGALTGVPSGLHTAGTGSFSGSPDYVANNSDTDVNLQIDNLPASLTMVRGGLLYVTEVYTSHNLITPLDRFGVTLPNTLYSIAYF
ncbi:MAG TPA: TadE family protein [Vicinamibacterales bacterium]|nr:TadE family protein [Vicinamibacterales bacterium]